MDADVVSDMSDLYERDFVRWSEEQAVALRAAAAARTNLALDWDHLAEEIDSLGKSLRSELRNRLATIIEHLLKLEVSPASNPRAGWMETIERERVDIELLLRDNPSLRAALSASMEDAAYKARRMAASSLRRHAEWTRATERALNEAHFVEEQVLGPWLPAEPAWPTSR